jgi:dsRNA-specific ribonuclease
MNCSNILNHTCFEFVKQKAFLKCFCHNSNNNSGKMFRGPFEGALLHELFHL